MKSFFLFLILCLQAQHVLFAQSPDDSLNFSKDLLAGINQLRTTAGLPALVLDDNLNRMAAAWAGELAHRDEMLHRKDLQDMTKQGAYSYLNENLYFSSQPPTATSVLQAWIKSPGHRRNLLQDKIVRMGVAAARSATGYYVVFNGAAVASPGQ